MPILHRSFYEAAVHVLPILAFVMAIGDRRLRAEPRDGVLGFTLSFSIVAFMLFAEFAALAALTGGDGSRAIAAIVLLGLMMGCIHLLMQFALVMVDEAVDEGDGLYELLPFIVTAISVLAILGGGSLIYLQATY